MSRWFRYYEEALDDHKVQRLSGDAFKAWVNLLCLASKNGGEILSLEDACFALRLSKTRMAAIITDLAAAELLDKVEGRYFAPHNWAARQYKTDVTDPTNAKRQKRFRQRHCNGPNTVTPTVTVTDTRDRAETEQNRDRNARAREVHAKFLETARINPDDPDFFGTQHQISAMISRGFTPETILAGTVRAMAGKSKTPSWPYISKCIESENSDRSAPAKLENSNAKTGNVLAAADRLIERVRAFDQPAPDEPG